MRRAETKAADVTIFQIVLNQLSELSIWTVMMSEGWSYSLNGPHIGEGVMLQI